MYYKAILYPDNTFEIKEIEDVNTNEITPYLKSVYSVYPEGYLYAVRQTREDAVSELKNLIKQNIERCESDLAKLRNQLNAIV